MLFFLHLGQDGNISAINQHLMAKHDKDTDKHKSLDIRKILINNTKLINENNKKKKESLSNPRSNTYNN